MLPTASRSIRDSAAWELIDRLRQSGHRFSYRRATPPAAGASSTRTHELRTALGHLDVQIRTTFTILQLQLLLHLEEELPDNASQLKPEPDLDSSDESSTDSDREDASSVSSIASAGSRGPVPAQPGTDIATHSAHPSSSQALFLLQNLCSLLEARVNPAMLPVQPRPLDRATSYPKLARLVQHVQSIPVSTGHLELIPIPGSAPTPFLFNVSEVAEMAAAFDSLRDPAQARPHKRVRQRMLAEVEFMRSRFLEFNGFVNSLQISIGSLESLAERPGPSPASSESFTSFAALQRFRLQASTAFRAIFSQFGLCPQRIGTEHKIFLRLPEWEDVSDSRSADAQGELPVQLSFKSCCLPGDWQPADVYLLQSEQVEACKTQKLCKALTNAYNNDRHLEFFVSEASEATGAREIPVHILQDPTSGRRRDDSFKFPVDNFWTLVKDDYFARQPTMELLLQAGSNAAVFGINQRKALAVKLVLGFMLSMDSDRIIGTWNLKRIHSFKPHETEHWVFVSINEENAVSDLKDLSLAKWDISGDYGAGDDDLQPLPPFTLLAKVLLQIARGERLRKLKIDCHSETTFRDGWKKLRRLVEAYMRNVTSGDGVDREVLPFLRAAQNCLDFHTLYQKHSRTLRSSPRMEIAWKLMFTDILSQIDSRLVWSGQSDLTAGDPVPVTIEPVESSVVTVVQQDKISSVTTVNLKTPKMEYPLRSTGSVTAQHEVALFDGEDVIKESIEVERAALFFRLLENFHQSYLRFVTDRSINAGIESPRRIRIAVLDTGIDFGHPGIQEAREKGRVKEEWCHSWVGDENDMKDEDDGLHGTNCAYLLHKAAPEADIYVEKVFQSTSFKSYQAKNIAKALNHAVKTWEVDIISMSFGLRSPPPLPDANEAEEERAQKEFECLVDDIQNAIRGASVEPRIMFAAASNNGKNERRAFPARYDPWVICVHASDGKGNDSGINPPWESDANFMTLGTGLELLERRWVVAGRTQRATYKTVYKSGTSFATPIAAGMAATVLDLTRRVSAINDRTREKIRRCEEMRKVLRLMSTPKRFGDHYCFLAPWNHWEEHWQANELKCRMAWDSINIQFGA